MLHLATAGDRRIKIILLRHPDLKLTNSKFLGRNFQKQSKMQFWLLNCLKYRIFGLMLSVLCRDLEYQDARGKKVADNGDWATEAVKMAGIYRHACVTIAALSADSSKQGFLRMVMEDSPPTLLGRSHELSSVMQDTPHAKRGWTYQELLLSTRILHFYEGWMIWECRSAKGLENTPMRDPTQAVLVEELRDVRHRSVPNSNQLNWWSWVHNYTSRALTHRSDRPAAFYGIIDHYSYRVKDERMTGLWSQTLLQDLLWRAQRPGSRIPAPSTTMPTWSWLSIDAQILAPASVDPDHTSVVGTMVVRGYTSCIFIPAAKLIEIRDHFLSFTGEPDSWVGSSTLVLQGKLQPARVSRHNDSRYFLCVIEEGVELEPQPCWMDCEAEIPSTGLVYCFFLGFAFAYPGMPQFAFREVLVLVPTADCSYHRIGVSRVHAEQLYADSEITRKGNIRGDGLVNISFADFDAENAVKLGFLDDDVTIILR